MIIDVLQSVGDKIVAVILATTALLGGLFASSGQTTVTPPRETALVYNQVAVAPITNLLPIVKLLPPKRALKPQSPVVAPVVAPPVVTAQWLLDNTKFSFKQKRDGTYEAVFTANAGGKDLTWGIGDAFIGGSAGIPKFAFSASCNPPLEIPPPRFPIKLLSSK